MRQFQLLIFLYVVVGVPACTAIASFLVGVFLVLLFSGAEFDLLGVQFWSGVAFVVGPLLVVAVAVRAWRRRSSGAPSFLTSGLTRAVPALIAVGLLGAGTLGIVARGKYVEQLTNEAEHFCSRWNGNGDRDDTHCQDTAMACLGGRPLDERAYAPDRVAALEACIDLPRQ